jgi:quercetin dioxygenase-like cupin family protein
LTAIAARDTTLLSELFSGGIPMAQATETPLAIKYDRIDTYKEWQQKQKIPLVTGFFVEDLNKVPVEPWDLKGVPCSFVVLDGTGGVNDGYVCEIPPKSKTKTQKHLYEEMVYVTQGFGATTVWQKDGKKHTFEWGPGSLFAVPINAYYQHFNASGTESARYFAVTNCCFMMNLFHNVDFIFNNDYPFIDRFDPSDDNYFSGNGEVTGRFFMTTNFVPDTHTVGLADYSDTDGTARTSPSMADNLNFCPNSISVFINFSRRLLIQSTWQHKQVVRCRQSRVSGIFAMNSRPDQNPS